MRIICDCCYNWIELEDDYKNYCEVECEECCATVNYPATDEEIEQQNTDVINERIDHVSSGRIRIMAIEETGEERCLRNNVPVDDDELVEILLAGYQKRYPEYSIFTESEDTYGNLDYI